MKALLDRNKFLYPAQTGLGRTVGINRNKNEVYMPAYVGDLGAGDPSYSLLKVNLNSGRGRVISKGNSSTFDWFVDKNGKPLVREDYFEASKKHKIYSKITGKWKLIYEKEVAIREITVDALNSDSTKLLFNKYEGDTAKTFSMDLIDGSIEGPLFDDNEEEIKRDIDFILTDDFNRMTGIRYSGLIPTYEFISPKLNEAYAKVVEALPGNTIRLASVSENLSKLIVQISGNNGSGDYYLYDYKNNTFSLIERGYPTISGNSIAEIKAYNLTARDGMKIPSIVTWPVNNEERKNLPLLVMPHGGPSSYDYIRFDWWAQYFARKGYLILQPNFRGSDGFGANFKAIGKRNWGLLMQDDVTDTVNLLIDAKFVDPNRICIMGASYGGYSALAGAAFTPELYRCAISVNGVTDLPSLLFDEKKQHGKRSHTVNYWKEYIGTDKDRLKQTSPARHADKIKAPVLLIHGKNDTVVSYKQSTKMEQALLKANKPVKLVKLKGEDHWLSKRETRLTMLRAIDEFLQQHNPI